MNFEYGVVSMKIGLALGSGGARGLAHIGVIQALEKLDIKIDFISGSSMGALVGAIYASQGSLEPLKSLVEETTWASVAHLFFPTFSKGGLVTGKRVVELLEETIQVRDFADLKIPLAVETTDLHTGTLNTITRGNLIDAVRASISIPLVFTPVPIQDKLLVDGGLLSPVPIQTVRDLGADFVIAVNVLGQGNGWLKTPHLNDHTIPNFIDRNEHNIVSRLLHPERHRNETDSQNKRHNAIFIVAQTVGIGVGKLAQYQIRFEQPDIALSPDTSKINIYDFHRGEEIIGDTFIMAYNQIKRAMSELPINIPITAELDGEGQAAQVKS